ncbi:catechol 2,3-dioxygenase-like lactoylglutathione lyase family enzyme [Pontibacter ummariensis]|uniref:Catechol 2,3-dioxygenase n=1 Tax=Pontibacter ummariensis TaxID=1610492 RepID=A0A239H340_9BACT|nr:VOC family protein [Pontibacter ummariensis]PRY10904.1 catechol 2,3-dioxygenase-like lactoylglutathione lyase family enzyme [Pontibacter ummariensis]SNS75800.1 Catechol 2,3-dioxygenase [Pontibacter ummariensis]
MKLEHFALNVEAPLAMAIWYVEHLGLQVVRQMEEAPYTTFLADDSGRIMIEVYRNPANEVPPYREMNPLLVHLAFVSEDPDKDRARLLQAGASLASDQKLEDGSHLVMLRDPWGLAVQLCKRGVPMLKAEEVKA